MIDCRDLLVSVQIKSMVIPLFKSVSMLHANTPNLLKEKMTKTARLFGAVPQVPDTP